MKHQEKDAEAYSLNHIDDLPLGFAVALDVALGHLQGGMARKLLDVPQRASRFDNLLGGVSYERPASRMAGAAVQAQNFEYAGEPYGDCARQHLWATLAGNDVVFRFWGNHLMKVNKGFSELCVQGHNSSGFTLGRIVGQAECIAYLA